MPDTLAPPKLIAPPGACDTHFHIYEKKYPMAETAVRPPPDAPMTDYQDAVVRRLGLERFVVVQPTAYGHDNRATLEAMEKLGGPAAAKGVVVVDTDVTDSEMHDLTAKGCVGIRFHMMPGGALPWDILEEMAARVFIFGWHVQLQLDGRTLPEYLPRLKRLPGTLVIDHIGKYLEPVDVDHPGFKALQELLDTGKTWVKLSAAYETSKSGPPHFDDVGILAKALIAQAPERMLWATNWPHPGNQNPRPDDAMLLDTLLDWAGDTDAINRILAHNPAVLYGFG